MEEGSGIERRSDQPFSGVDFEGNREGGGSSGVEIGRGRVIPPAHVDFENWDGRWATPPPGIEIEGNQVEEVVPPSSRQN